MSTDVTSTSQGDFTLSPSKLFGRTLPIPGYTGYKSYSQYYRKRDKRDKKAEHNDTACDANNTDRSNLTKGRIKRSRVGRPCKIGRPRKPMTIGEYVDGKWTRDRKCKDVVIAGVSYKNDYKNLLKRMSSKRAFKKCVEELDRVFSVKKTIVCTGVTMWYSMNDPGRVDIRKVQSDLQKLVLMIRNGGLGSGYLFGIANIETYSKKSERGYHIHMLVYSSVLKDNIYNTYEGLKRLWGKIAIGGVMYCDNIGEWEKDGGDDKREKDERLGVIKVSDKEKIQRHLEKVAYTCKDQDFRDKLDRRVMLHRTFWLIPRWVAIEAGYIHKHLAASEKLEDFHPYLRDRCTIQES